MKTASILLVLAVVAGAGRGAQGGGCGRAGALRCDADGRHLSACTKGGAWWPVRDCGASHAACVDGRCVPLLSSGATRADGCAANTWGCKDCYTRQYCSASGNWIDVGKCDEDNEFCICGECKPQANNKCGSSFICSSNTEGVYFPNPSDCKQKLFCGKEGEAPTSVPCPPGNYFDPCGGDCDIDCFENEPCGSGDLGYFKTVLGNPSLYYLCAGEFTIFFRCPGDKTFYPTMEKCLTPVISCANNGTPTTTTDGMNSVMKHVSYEDCSSNGSIPSGCTPGEKLADPDNDCQYYFCISSDNKKLMTCNENTKFDATVKNCVVSSGSCLKV